MLLAQGPLKHDQWELVDHVTRSMARMRELLRHEPTRRVIEADHDGIALLLPLLSDSYLQDLLDGLQRERPQAQQKADEPWSLPEHPSNPTGATH